jgi:hypothetical protein
MFVIVHVPKTAGTSFGHLLKDHFGDHLRTIYGEGPMNRTSLARQEWLVDLSEQELNYDYSGIHCVFGHFLPYRYSLLAEIKPLTFITWMRHPIKRAISEYYFILRYKDMFLDKPFHGRLILENWSLEQYLFCKEHQNYFDQYFWRFPLTRFSFIGVVEHFEEDLAFFNRKYLNKTYRPVVLNQGDYSRSADLLSVSMLKELELHHQKDMDLYQQALDLRERRLNQ